MHYLNHLHIIVLLHNGPNVLHNMLGDSFRIIYNKHSLNLSIRWNLAKVFAQVLKAECQTDHLTQQSVLFLLFDTSLLHILAIFSFRLLLRGSQP